MMEKDVSRYKASFSSSVIHREQKKQFLSILYYERERERERERENLF